LKDISDKYLPNTFSIDHAEQNYDFNNNRISPTKVVTITGPYPGFSVNANHVRKDPKISRGNLLKELEVPVGKAGGLVPQLHPLLHQLQGGGVVHTRQVRSRLHTLCIRMTIIVIMLITKIISFLSTVR
jgi:hypothetical protein